MKPPSPADDGAGKPRRGWYGRGYLPHFDAAETIQFLTWRLADSLPRPVLEKLDQELASLKMAPQEQEAERRRRIEAMLDRSYGECWLRRHACASLVRKVFQEGDGFSARIHAWVIMPNHVHVLAEPLPGFLLEEVTGAWKGSTSQWINEELGRNGSVWQEDYWDRYIRDAAHYENTVRYIMLNPVRAGLVKNPAQWKWWWVRGQERQGEFRKP